ncbi:MAG TPA: ATP-binding protein [Anaerolineae bacterium]
MSARNPLRRPRLGTLLVGINVGLLLLAIAIVTFMAVSLLQQLADDQAHARVTQAGSSAHQAVLLAGAEIASDAQLLGERPTLLRLLQAGDRESLSAFLSQFQQTSQRDASAVFVNDRVFAQSGASLPWDALWAAHHDDDNAFIDRAEAGLLVAGARSLIQSGSNAAVMVVVRLDESFARRLSDEIGMPAAVLDAQAVSPADPLVEIRSEVVTTGKPASARRDEIGAYIALFPLRASSGEVIGLLEARLPTTGVGESLRQFAQALLGLTLIVAALAAWISFLFGRWLARPVHRLTEAAGRIGHGDLSTPIAVAPGGEIGTLASTLEDMRSRLLRLTAHLRQQQAESSAIITSIVEGVFSVDRQRRIRFVNPQTAAMLGIDAQAALGRFCGDVLNPRGPDGTRPCEEHCPIVHARFRSGARATEHLLLNSGQRRTVVITSAPPAENQQVQVMRDETEVEAARRLRDAVLANISHEFRTPLSAQLASIELLLDQLPDLATEQIAELVVRLQRGTLRLTQLIDNLLESVRIEAGEYAIRRDPVAIDEIIEDALEFTRPLIEQQEQSVNVELPYPLPAVSGDARRLTQVFVNLLANANKFAPRGSTIGIGGTVEPGSVTLWVEDEGPGMPPSMAGQSLFERFVRSSSEEPEQSGVGLGLWIVKSIVERHGGHVGACDGTGGRGTRVCVTLPSQPMNDE